MATKKTEVTPTYEKQVKAVKAEIADAAAREKYNGLVTLYNSLLAAYLKSEKNLANQIAKTEKLQAKIDACGKKSK